MAKGNTRMLPQNVLLIRSLSKRSPWVARNVLPLYFHSYSSTILTPKRRDIGSISLWSWLPRTRMTSVLLLPFDISWIRERKLQASVPSLPRLRSSKRSPKIMIRLHWRVSSSLRSSFDLDIEKPRWISETMRVWTFEDREFMFMPLLRFFAYTKCTWFELHVFSDIFYRIRI